MVSALGLDIGRKRIGIAGCDGLGLFATGLTTIHRRSFREDVEQLRQIVDERQVEILVVGLPYTMDGNLGSQARQTQKLARRFSKVLNVPIEYVDERLTSIEAKEMMQNSKQSLSQNKGMVDRKAAAIILQRWLSV